MTAALTIALVVIGAVALNLAVVFSGWRMATRTTTTQTGTAMNHRRHIPALHLPPVPPVEAELDLPPGQAFARWVTAVKRRHFWVLVHHPHHYAAAAGLSLGLAAVGHWESGAVMAAWLYAFVENVATAAEAVVFEA